LLIKKQNYIFIKLCKPVIYASILYLTFDMYALHTLMNCEQ